MEGYLLYAVTTLILVGIYAVMALGLNLQWGYGGIFNAGVAGFFAVGAYTSAILTSPGSPQLVHAFALPVPIGLLGAMIASGLVAYAIGRICLRLESDYLAIATIGIAEILRLVVRNQQAYTGGAFGIPNLPRPFDGLGLPWSMIGFLGVVVLCIVLVYAAQERLSRSPWGRVMRAIRDNPRAAAAVGKDVGAFRLQAFVIGSMAIGLGGALSAHYFKFIGPEATEPLFTTFIVWVMVIVGGSGNHRGAILGALAVWLIWSMTEFATSRLLPQDWAVRAAYARILLIGLLLQVVLQRYPQGLLPERVGATRGRPPGG
jgi:branched-chain amino acid transport system permease protein